WLLAGAMLLALPAMAKEGDTFRPFVSLGDFYDSNLFRLDENESPGTQRDDRYALLSAGANVDWKPGRQQVVANLTKTLIRYDQNTFLDFAGDDMQATWNWRLGNRLSGNLGAAKSTSQSSFSDIGQVNNQVDRERRYGRAEWEFHPRWRIGGGLETTDNTNSAPSQLSQNVQQQVQDMVLSYRTPKGSNLRAQVRRIDAEYPNQQTLGFTIGSVPPFLFTQVWDNSYKQIEYNLLGDWRLSGKFTLRSQVGWVDRQYKNILRNDLGGAAVLSERSDTNTLAGRASADWFATSKTLLSVTAYQELGDVSDINASSLLKTGASLSGVWLIREKWRLSLGATYENRDFKDDSGGTQLQRNDDTLGSSLSISYTPHSAVGIDLGTRSGSRDSNISGEDYSFHLLFVNVRANF
ncbi:XrtB/PEP-CTERM-associated polysaccharide biosynthesis outer membrane protein EpsL, partial [Sulfuriferula sp.]|uniref:XrtB/PEP-CTERM-associated polysaccharide biosynthesis outer membrane protein EpsL n=1 Tax=Sulfuriferula sp. TaxID=2025307 RepID=UPI0027301CFC